MGLLLGDDFRGRHALLLHLRLAALPAANLQRQPEEVSLSHNCVRHPSWKSEEPPSTASTEAQAPSLVGERCEGQQDRVSHALHDGHVFQLHGSACHRQ